MHCNAEVGSREAGEGREHRVFVEGGDGFGGGVGGGWGCVQD